MAKTVKCRSGQIGWQDRLRKVYDNDFEQFQAYDRVYGIASRIGYKTVESAWRHNPMIQGSVNPSDLRQVRKQVRKR